jgi:mannose-6-phosphate isomerase-like protein (cupin superfamily)
MIRVRISRIENRSLKVTSPEGEILEEILGHQAGGAKSHSLAEVTIPSGMSSAPHFHQFSEESYLILSGEAEIYINQVQIHLATGDAILIQPGETHQIINQGHDDLVFLAVCAPAWHPDDNFPTQKA